MLGRLSKTIAYKEPTVLLKLYKSLAGPHLEYYSSVWSQHFDKVGVLLEHVKHRFTRLFPELRKLPQEINCLGLWSLEERRNREDLIKLFRSDYHESQAHTSLYVEKTASLKATAGNYQRNNVVAIIIYTSSLSESCTKGILWIRLMLTQHRRMFSRVGKRRDVFVRWTSSDTPYGGSTSPMAARPVKKDENRQEEGTREDWKVQQQHL